jgi:hypothetical protein
MKVIKKSASRPSSSVAQPNPTLQKYSTVSARLIFLLKLLGNDTIFSHL